MGIDAYKTLVAAMELSAERPVIRFDRVVEHSGIEVMEAARRAAEFHSSPPSEPERR